MIHDRMMRLIDVGIAPNHAAFPQQLLDDHLARAAYTTSENQRIAMGRYVTIMEQLRKAELDKAGAAFDLPGIGRFAVLMRNALVTRHDLLAEGNSRLHELVQTATSGSQGLDLAFLDRQLTDWVASATERGLPQPPH